MSQPGKKFRFWVVISIAWFFLATVIAAVLAYQSTSITASGFDTGDFNTFLIILHMPLIIGWGIWWRAPGLLNRFNNMFTESGCKDESRERLRRMLTDGLQLLNRSVRTEIEFNRWKTDDENWVSAVHRELKTEFDESLAESFQTVENVQEFEVASSYNREHNSRKMHLNKRLNNLINIID